jgi:type II secretory pathway pseudopilin PulG
VSRQRRIDGSQAAEGGFALPAVLFALTIMAILAVVAFRTADDERRAERALRETGAALYVADAGLRNTLGTWDTSAVRALAPGDSLDLGWQQLSNHASFRSVIQRVDNGGMQQYAVVVYAKGAGALGG